MSAVVVLESPNDFAGNGTDLCRVCHTPTRDHGFKPCPLFGMDLIYGAPLKVVNAADQTGTCVRYGCENAAQRRKNSFRYTKYCGAACRVAHNRARRER